MAKRRLNGERLRTAGIGKTPARVDAARQLLHRLWKKGGAGRKRAGDPRQAQPATMFGLSRLRWLLSRRSSLPNRLDFACAGRLQQDEALARGFLRIQVALSFVLDLQAGPFIRIDGLEVGSFELAIRRRLR